MKWKELWAKDFTGYMNVLNDRFKLFTKNISEDNLNLNQIEIKQGITAPAAKDGKAIIYIDAADGNLKIKKEDGTIKIFTLV